MRVVLAGGGSAGHIEPALALADALRAADSSIEVICLGTQRGLETRLVPLRGYPLELIPAVPLPRSVTPKLLTVPGRLAGAIHATGTILEPGRRRRARRLRRLRRHARLPGRQAAQGADRGARGESLAGHRQQARRPPHHARVHRESGHASCATPGTWGCRSGGRSRNSTGSRSATRRARTSGSAPTCPCCSSPVAPRAPSRSTGRWPARSARSGAPGCRSCR